MLLTCLRVSVCPAHAQDELTIPESCGSQRELEREVDALRRSDAHSVRVARPSIRLGAEGDGYRLDVRFADGERRALRDTDCRALFRAAIVIAALGHAPPGETLTSETPHPATAPPLPSKPSAAATEPARRTQPPQGSEDSARTEVPVRSGSVLLSSELAYGVVPAWSAALSAGLALARGRWGARVTLGYQTPRTHRAATGGVRVQGVSAGLTLEARPVRWLWLGPGAELFLLYGRGVDFPKAHGDWASQPALHLAARAALFTRGAFTLMFSARGLWAPQPSSFSVVSGPTLYRARHFGFQAGLSFGFQIL